MDGAKLKVRARAGLFPALIGLNALAVLAFRHFVSLDGPMHLLHAAVLRDALSGKVRAAEGMWVDVGSLDLNLGDLLLIGLSGLVHPFVLHKLLAVVAVTCVCMGAWRMARAYERDLNAAWLLVLPCAFGFTLLLGLFHFLIAVGIAFAISGWWVSRPSIRWHELLLLLLGCAVGTFAHKTGGALLLLLAGLHEAVLRACDAGAWRARWAALPSWTAPVLATSIVVSGLVAVAFRFSATPVIHPHEPHRPLWELITLRPLLLTDSIAERPLRITCGSAFIGLLAMAGWERRHSLRKPTPADALLLTAVILLLVSFIRTPKTELLYVTDRAQWLALLLTVCWLSVQRLPRTLTPIIALGILSLHTVRLVYIERRMHGMEARDRAVLAAARSFQPGALVVPVVLDDDWLARHRTAYAAIGHDGILFTGRDHLRFGWKTPPIHYLRNYVLSPENNWGWIGQHIRKGIAPELRQVLVLDAADEAALPAWRGLHGTLREDYALTCDEGYAQVWTRKTSP